MQVTCGDPAPDILRIRVTKLGSIEIAFKVGKNKCSIFISPSSTEEIFRKLKKGLKKRHRLSEGKAKSSDRDRPKTY